MNMHLISRPERRRSNTMAKAGVATMLASFVLRVSAAGYMLLSLNSAHSIAVAAAVYLVGKALFYLGLFIAGPAILQRCSWLRSAHWLNQLRKRDKATGSMTPDSLTCAE